MFVHPAQTHGAMLELKTLLPLALEVDLLPTWAEVYDIMITWGFHCFDILLPNQHFYSA